MAKPIGRKTADDWVMVQEAGRILGIGPDRVRALVRDGQLQPAGSISGWKIYRRADVEALKAVRASRGIYGNTGDNDTTGDDN